LYLPSIAILVTGGLRAQPFTTLQPGYTQELWAVSNQTSGVIFGGLAFASNGDLWAKACGNTVALFRFDASRTVTANGASLHPPATPGASATASACGMVNHPDGRIYVNTIAGVQRFDAATGGAVGLLGQAGNNYGIAVDPQTKRLIYPAAACLNTTSCTLLSLDPTASTGSQSFLTFSLPATLEYVDGVDFDPTGNYVFVAGRTGVFPQDTPYLIVITRSGSIVRQLPADRFPDGVAFHKNPFYLITNNNDGTITRFDFPGGDPRQVPTQTVIASGGFRGDLSAIGADGCFYATQAGARYPNGVVTAEQSVVRICSTQGEFPPSPGVAPSDPVIRADGIVNASGYQTELTPDCVFTAFGLGLGPAALVLAASTNYQTTLGGTSITFTPDAGGTPINARIVYTVATQVAGLLPSNMAPGAYSVRVAYSGRTSAPRKVTVVARRFGIATQNSSGDGTAQATIGNVNNGLSLTRFTPGSVAFGGYNWTQGPAHVGDTLVLWGTGGGADQANDTGSSSGDQTSAGSFLVLVNGRSIKPAYAGASDGYPGLWQVNFTVPADLTPDCFASVVVSAGGRLSNTVVIPIAAAGQSACTDSDLAAGSLTRLDSGGNVTAGDFTAGIVLSTQNSVQTETVSGAFSRWTVAQWAARKALRPPAGQCSLLDRPYSPNDPVDDFAASLDAGARLSLNGPGIAAGTNLVSSIAPNGPAYSYNPPTGSITAGTYTLSGAGGSQVGQFTAAARVPGSFQVTNLGSITVIDRTQALALNWTGSGVDSVIIRITSLGVTGTPGRLVVASCSAAGNAGAFSIPASVLGQLPDSPASVTLTVMGLASPGTFQASLADGGQIDFGSFVGSISLVKTVTVR
jgi:uncharacterized protein (TIGR03437 family)